MVYLPIGSELSLVSRRVMISPSLLVAAVSMAGMV
jgi:hypothetical protein